jgi:hypothetical protein
MTVLEELSEYKLVGVQEVNWNRGGPVPAGKYTLFYGKGNKFFFVHKRIISAVMKVEFVSDRISYIILSGNIVLNVHASTVDKTDDVKDSFYEELERVFSNFPKYYLNILLRDSNAKTGREVIFKLTIGNESLHEISNGN